MILGISFLFFFFFFWVKLNHEPYTSERNLKSSTGKSLGNPTVVFNAAIISSPLKLLVRNPVGVLQ
jgi:hypothetical protein